MFRNVCYALSRHKDRVNVLKDFWETKTKIDNSRSNSEQTSANEQTTEVPRNVKFSSEDSRQNISERGSSVGFCEKTQQFVVKSIETENIEPISFEAKEPVFVEGRSYSAASGNSGDGKKDEGKINEDRTDIIDEHIVFSGIDRISNAHATFLHAENDKTKLLTDVERDTESEMMKKHKKLPVIPDPKNYDRVKFKPSLGGGRRSPVNHRYSWV